MKTLPALAVVLGLLALLAPAAMAATTLTLGANPVQQCSGGRTFCFDKDNLTAPGGDQVTVNFNNPANAAVAHSVCFGLQGGNQCTPNAQSGTPAGQSATVTFTSPASGTVAYWCDVPGHRESGMQGNLTISAAAPPGGDPTGPSQRPAPSVGVASIAAGLALLALAVRRRA